MADIENKDLELKQSRFTKKQLRKFFKACLKLAKKASGYCHPNPYVGAVIIHNNKIVAKGYHKFYGADHAEVMAIKHAKKKNIDLSQSQIFITLEPCTHFGKTPPCCDAIINANIKEVYISSLDPNEEAKNGFHLLRKKGIKCYYIKDRNSYFLNRAFFKAHKKNQPYIIAKSANSLNGFLSSNSNKRLFVTNANDQIHAHKFRLWSDAIITSYKTIMVDKPKLNIRINNKTHKQPKIVIIDSLLNIAHDFDTEYFADADKFIIIASKNAPKDNIDFITSKNIKILFIDVVENNKINLKLLLCELFALRFMAIMIEAGPNLLSAFYNENLVDETINYTSFDFIDIENHNINNTHILCNKKGYLKNYKKLESSIFTQIIHKEK